MVQTIVAVVLIGILAKIGLSLMRDTTSTGYANALARNALEINNTVNSITSHGGTFAQGTYGFTNGNSSAGASFLLPATATPSAVASFIAQLTSAGAMSYGTTSMLARSPTASSYTYSWSGNMPVFSGIAGSPP